MKEHDQVVNLIAYTDIPMNTPGRIILDYGTGYFEVEFFVNGVSIVQTASAKSLKPLLNENPR